MDTRSKKGIVGLAFIGAGTIMTAAGFLLVAPICASWSRKKLTHVYEKGKEGVISGIETAADVLAQAASKAERPLSEIAKAARETTAVAAGAVESAAHYVREHVS